MNENAFWEIVAKLDWNQTGDDEAVVWPVVRDLARRDVEEIFAFDELLAEKMFALDGERFATQIGENAYSPTGEDSFSQDSFVYARAWVVANGRAFYESVRSNPSRMPKDMEFEALLYVAAQAYERKTGNEYTHVTKSSIETCAN